jgi:hypothetical protein
VYKEQEFLDEYQYSSEKNVETKIFKSIKYYYIKNLLKHDDDDLATKKKYDRSVHTNIKLSDTFVNEIYEYLALHYQDSGFKPSDCFDKFVEDHAESVQHEMRQLYSKYEDRKLNDDDITFKIKKAFKNQYFAMRCEK